jgi:predicted Zn-dependent protease
MHEALEPTRDPGWLLSHPLPNARLDSTALSVKTL